MLCVSSMIVYGRALKNVHYSVVQINYSFWGIILSLPFLWIEKVDHRLFHYDQRTIYCQLGLIGLTNTAAMTLFVFTTQFAKPTTVSLLRYVSIIYFFLSDILIFKQQFEFM